MFGGMQLRKEMCQDTPPKMDELAASLNDVYRGISSESYTNSESFMSHNFQTKSMKKVITTITNRLKHGKGNSLITLSTPFGGGKTHTMIYAYHMAKKMGINPVVIDGHYDTQNTLWSEIETQLNGDIKHMTMDRAPGERLIEMMLDGHESVLILIDELLAHMLAANRILDDDTMLATQTLFFIQQLSEVAKRFKKMCVIISYPTNSIITRDQAAQELENDLRSRLSQYTDRTSRSMAPVEYKDVPSVIRRRLFSGPDYELTEEAKDIICEYVEKCKRNGLTNDNKISDYKQEFERTYPFVPEVIDVLYHNWGSYPTFQRTRGMLQLLGTVLYSLKESNKKYITLADFDLRFYDIRSKFLGNLMNTSYDSVLSTDITEESARATLINHGRECATVIFLMSFGLDLNKPGAKSEEIKKAMVDSCRADFSRFRLP